jgi:hypothetical protein
MTDQITLMGNDNPERNAIVSDLLLKLSAEAKFVLYSIFNTPGELSQLLFGDMVHEATEPIKWMIGGRMNKARVRKYLKLLGWETKDINITVFALKEFTRELGRL